MTHDITHNPSPERVHVSSQASSHNPSHTLSQGISHQGISKPSTPLHAPIKDKAELGRLIAKNKDKLHHFIARNIKYPDFTEDLFQSACVEATRAYHKFRGDSAPSTWLFGIARNIIRNYVHRSPSFRYQFVDTDILINTASKDNTPEQDTENKEHISQVDSSIDSLPHKLRSVLKMVVEEHSYEDISSQLGISVGTVRSRLSRARSQLKRKMNSKSLESGVSLMKRKESALYRRLRSPKHEDLSRREADATREFQRLTQKQKHMQAHHSTAITAQNATTSPTSHPKARQSIHPHTPSIRTRTSSTMVRS